jgi:hypothetical protein
LESLVAKPAKPNPLAIKGNGIRSNRQAANIAISLPV